MEFSVAKTLFLDLLYCKGNLHAVLERYKRSTQHTLITIKNWDYIVSKEGIKFYVTTDVYTPDDIIRDYRYSDIKKNDVVLDIGANIGGFALRVASMCNIVHAYEPVRTKELLDNIKLNGINNITVHPEALGDGSPINIRWQGDENTAPTTVNYTPTYTIRFSDMPACDFLKCDCEGAEWLINPQDLSEINHIEMELHTFDNHMRNVSRRTYKGWLKELSKTHDCEVSPLEYYDVYGILHAYKR